MASSTADTAADDKAECTQKRGIKVTERERERERRFAVPAGQPVGGWCMG